MNIRENMEQRERELLSPYASHSADTRGRDRPEEECGVRTAYQRDRDRILHCKAFRRMKDKTQVFLAPQGDHYRTRLTHTLEVSQIARTIAKALRLNEDLVEAIALGHDLGHTPFGHAGERALDQIHPGGFAHYKQSVRVVEVLEKNGNGLNLTWEVRNGIMNHRTSGNPSTLEGQVVRFSDKIAYIHHDMDDAQRAGIITEDDIPVTMRTFLGYTTRERLNTFVHNIIENSMEKDSISMSPDVFEAMMELRALMFRNVSRWHSARNRGMSANHCMADADRITSQCEVCRQIHLSASSTTYSSIGAIRNGPVSVMSTNVASDGSRSGAYSRVNRPVPQPISRILP